MSKARKRSGAKTGMFEIKLWNRESAALVKLTKQMGLQRLASHVGLALWSTHFDAFFDAVQRVPNAKLRQQLKDAFHQFLDATSIRNSLDELLSKPTTKRRK